MKRQTILIILIAFFIISCNSAINNDIAGTYTNQSKSEYSVASDTLIITLVNQTENTYQIQSRTGYQRIKDKVLQPKQYKKIEWQAIYNSQKNTISEGELGIQISLGENKNSILIKNTEYKRSK